MKKLLVATMTCLFALGALPAIANKAHDNRVSYGDMMPGQRLKLFQKTVPGYQPDQGENWADFSKRKEAIWAPPPASITLSQRVTERLQALSYATGTTLCNSTPRILFLAGPRGKAKLYAYEYLLCDDSKLLSSAAVIDQYIDRYGMYDAKNYDINQIIYRDVKKQYRIGVRPFMAEDGRSGVVITVVDDHVFEEYYGKWRHALRTAGKRIRDRF